MKTNIFKEIVRRLQQIGLINMIIESQKITDNVSLMLTVFTDELRNAFKEYDYVQRVAQTL